ncbi:ABC transporter [Hirsutella rhossiliensis]
MDTACPSGADSEFGPRVHVACRAFDFTLLFQDAFFIALPAAVFLILLPWRLWSLCRRPVLATSVRLALCKLGFLSALFCLHIALATLRAGTPGLYSRLGLASDILAAVSVFVAVEALVVVLESARKTGFLQPSYKSAAIEQVTSFWNRSFFVWLLPFFNVGYSKDLDLQDIPKVSRDLEEESTRTRLTKAWRNTRGKHRLLRATFFANSWFFGAAVPPRLALSAFTFCQPFLIESSVSYLNATPDQDYSRFRKALVGAFLLTYLGIAVSRALYWRQTYRMTTAIRAGLISSIYRHTITLKAVDVQDSAALTLMGTDVERIAVSLRLVHEIWASIPEVAVAIWLLARQISAASVVPLVVCLASVAAASRIASSFGPAQKAWVDRVQTRVAATAGMLSDIKAVKMLGLTEVLSKVISQYSLVCG